MLKNGRKVITDRELTIQYIYNVYYWYSFPIYLTLTSRIC